MEDEQQQKKEARVVQKKKCRRRKVKSAKIRRLRSRFAAIKSIIVARCYNTQTLEMLIVVALKHAILNKSKSSTIQSL